MTQTTHPAAAGTPDIFPAALLVQCQGGQVYTTSLKVAEHFGKHHRDVLRAIRAYVQRTSNPARLRNFAQSFFLEVVFGDAWVQDWCVVGVGNYRTQPVRR